MYVTFKQLENGNLSITLDERGKSNLEELNDLYNEKKSLTLWDLCEHYACNGWWIGTGDQLGHLTEADFIIEDPIYRDGNPEKLSYEPNKAWYFPDYMIVSPVAKILNEGEVIFRRV